MKFDDVLREIGEFGPFQKRVYILAVAPALIVSFEALSVIFVFNIPDHRCALPGHPSDTYHPHNDTHAAILNVSIPKVDGKWDKCSRFTDDAIDTFLASNWSDTNVDISNASRSECDNWVFDHSTFESTIATDFDVVCSRSVYRASSHMTTEIGTMFGTWICGFLADRFGRKITFYIGGLALIGGGFGIAFATNLVTLNICRFIIGIARLSTWVNGLVIGMEIVGPSKRTFAGLAIEFVWCAGEFLLLLMAYYIRNWRYLEIAVSVPSIGLLFYWWLIPESPRWLASRGREKEAMLVLEKITASNKTKLPEFEDARELLEKEEDLSFLHIFRSRELIVRMLIVFSNMFVLVMVYYGLTLNITNLSGNIFQNFALNIVLELVACILPLFLVDRVGRKPVYCGSMLLAGAACVVSVLPVMINAQAWIVSVLSMVGRFFVSVSYAVIYLYGAELFPTVVRTSTMSAGISFSRAGNIISPYLADVGILMGGKLKEVLPLLVMGSPAVLVGLLSLWLPETLGIKLPETMADVKNCQRKRRWGCYSSESDKEDKKCAAMTTQTETKC